MKTIKIYLTLFTLALLSTACLVDDTVESDAYANTPNIAGFVDSSQTIGGVTDNSEYMFTIPLEVKGPTITSLTEDVSVVISVDPSSTAVENTHFKFTSNSMVLSKGSNYSGALPITLITNGITAPLVESPKLILNISTVTSDGNVIANGKKLTMTLNYLCFSNLAGDYNVTIRYVRASSGIDNTYTFVDTLTSTSDGSYRTDRVGHWTPAQLGGTPGMDILDVCNEITIPAQNLVELYSNMVEGVSGASSVDPITGVITMEYTICASDCREYFATYTPI